MIIRKKFKKIDVLIHLNGAGIHPDFLKNLILANISLC